MNFKNGLKVIVFAVSITLGGCSTIGNKWGDIETSYTDIKFEERVRDSKLLIQEANIFMSEGDYTSAKKKLDEAYIVYAKQASLHDSYRNYYEILGNVQLAELATKRFEGMIRKSNVLNEKGRYAMVQLNHEELAADLFNLSLIYHEKNTSTLVNIATLAYSTDDIALAIASLKMLDVLGHRSPEASILEYLVADKQGDFERKMLVKLIMKISWPESIQYHFIETGEIKDIIYGA
jgi:Tfp pilus assembly protein PilF